MLPYRPDGSMKRAIRACDTAGFTRQNGPNEQSIDTQRDSNAVRSGLQK